MPGIYIHIPFCQAKCDYCNFFSMASLRGRDEISRAVCNEIYQRREYLSDNHISTIYFGGGTPSLLSAKDIDMILNELTNVFDIENDAEITFEANPNDVTKEKLEAWRNSGINRISLGIQSFQKNDLEYLGRMHSAAQAVKAVEESQWAGFTNISIDLIFGLPVQEKDTFEKNLEIFHSLRLPHLSAYALTVEPGTALAWKIRRNRKKAVNDEAQATQFLFLMDWMETNGYVQYEISNFCLPNYESRHNSAYWTGEKYLGLGPSAHSFDGVSRQWNVSNLTKYLDAITHKNKTFEKEILTPDQFREEYVMTSVRTSRGIDLLIYEERFGAKDLERILQAAESYIVKGWLIHENDHLLLSREGKLFADHITAGLF